MEVAHFAGFNDRPPFQDVGARGQGQRRVDVLFDQDYRRRPRYRRDGGDQLLDHHRRHPFRGFIQKRLEASFGTAPGLAGAALLYGLYHVGYGMGVGEIWFLVGLGVVYAVAFRLAENVLVLWPLLTPVGSFFNNLQAGAAMCEGSQVADVIVAVASIDPVMGGVDR